MIRSQSMLIVPADMDLEEAHNMAKELDCVAFFRGLPMILMGLAAAESWVLPYVWTENWDDQDS